MNSGRPSEVQCRVCGASVGEPFYRAWNVPAHSVRQMRSRREAIEFPRGDIVLTCCGACGFIQNNEFDATLQDYASDYEETQGFSDTFSGFQRRLAAELVARFDLRGRRILEIGCGKGAFLTLLCQLGDNHGIGFDPAYAEDRLEVPPDPRVHFVRDLFSARYAGEEADFVCCQMTLEHVEHPLDLLRTVCEAEGVGSRTQFFVQVPDVKRILSERAFWDIYYEHCSYFGYSSLIQLFRRSGFDVTDVWRDYDDQYLMVCGRRRSGAGAAADESRLDEDVEQLKRAAQAFGRDVEDICARNRSWLRALAADRRRVVLWGAGSKAVAFLSTLGLDGEIEYAVDVNPYRQGTFLAGGGQKIIGPSELAALDPDVVIMMNPVYMDEIRSDLARLSLSPKLLTVNDVAAQAKHRQTEE